MTYQHYTAEFKAKIVLEILQGERELGEVAKEYSINPNLIRKWRTTFLERASQHQSESDPEMADDVSGESQPSVRGSGEGSVQSEAEGGEPGEEAAANAVHDRPVDAGTRLSPGCLSPHRATRPPI